MNAERLRRLATRLFKEQAFCIFCGEKEFQYLIKHTGNRGNVFFLCANCLSDVIQEM